MDNKLFMRADEVAKELGVSQAYAYKLIKELNEELKAKGYLVINGRLNREYFAESFIQGITERRCKKCRRTKTRKQENGMLRFTVRIGKVFVKRK